MLITWRTPSTAGCDRSPAACPALAAPRRGHPTLQKGLLPATLPKTSLILPKRHLGTPQQQGLGAELNPGCPEGLGSIPGTRSCIPIWAQGQDLGFISVPLSPDPPRTLPHPTKSGILPPLRTGHLKGSVKGFIPCFTTRLVVYFLKDSQGAIPSCGFICC